MKSVKYLLALIALCVGVSTATAQLKTRYFYVGVGLGATNYKGDLDDNFALKFTKPGLGFIGGYKFHPHMSARLMLAQGWMKASDAKAARDIPRLRRNLSFRSPITEASLTFIYEFFANDRKFMYRPQYSPYIFGGVAVFAFNPQGKLGNEWYDLQPLGTEGQFMANCHQGQTYLNVTGDCPQPYKLVQLSIPFGLGIRYKLTDKIDLNAELGLRKTFTDYIDDVSGYYVNVDQLRAEQGETAAVLSDRIDRSIYPQGGEFWNGIRGDKSQSDWYVLSMVSATYILDWVICPKFR
jgi:Outer membrane protein beta-barrel domain